LAILRSAEFGVRIGDIGQPSGNGAAPVDRHASLIDLRVR